MNKETESMKLLELLDQNEIHYMLNHEGIGFLTQYDQDRAKELANLNGLEF